MKNRKTIILSLSVFMMIMFFGFVIYRSQAQQTLGSVQQNELPTVDLANLSLNEISPERKIKNSRYNTSPGRTKIRQNVNDTEVRIMHPRFDRLPAIPLPMADLVLIGTVTEASAFISDDESNVYSEFSISPRNIIFSKLPLQILPNDKVFVSREGGNIKFPSGRIVTYSARGQGSLKPESTYILFLEKTNSNKDFTLITAYKILDNTVHPIDPGQKFDEYRNVSVNEFLNRLKM